MAKFATDENTALLMNTQSTHGNLKTHDVSHPRKRSAEEIGNCTHADEERQPKRSRFQAWFGGPARALSTIFGKSQTHEAQSVALQHPESAPPQPHETCEAVQAPKRRVVPSSTSDGRPLPSVSSDRPSVERSSGERHAQRLQAAGSRPVPGVSSIRPASERGSDERHAQRSQVGTGASARVRFAETEASGLLDLLEIQPQMEIDFSRENATTLTIKNISTGFVAYKFKASSCMCLARPSRGTLEPSQVQQIRLSLATALDGKTVKEQYLVQAATVQSSTVLSRDAWAAMGSKGFHELRLPAVRQIIESRSVDQSTSSDSTQELHAKLVFKKTPCGAEAWLTLRNAANAEIAYRLQAPNNSYTVTPSSGRLKALAHTQICIKWVGTHVAFNTRPFLLQTIPLQSAGIANFESWAKLPKDLIQDQWMQAELEA